MRINKSPSSPKVYFNYGGNQPTTLKQYTPVAIPNRDTIFTFASTSAHGPIDRSTYGSSSSYRDTPTFYNSSLQGYASITSTRPPPAQQ